MAELPWLVPLGIGLVAVLFAAALTILVVRLSRRSPRAREAARAARREAETALLRLDDAVDDLDIAVEASGALIDGPDELRRARAAAARTRDRGYTEVAALRAPNRIPAEVRADAVRIRGRLSDAVARVERTRADLDSWADAHRPLADRLAAARARLDETLAATGDPAPLQEALRRRFDVEDIADAESAARQAADARAAADDALAAGEADSPHRATRATRVLARSLRGIEEMHRSALQAAENVEREIATVRVELTGRPDLADAAGAVDRAAETATRRPRAAIAAVARARERMDAAPLGSLTTRQRIEAARAALPGTLACARTALTAAETAADGGPLDARLRRQQARRELAAARAATDPVSALVAARAAWSDALEASAS
ncbi:hypothetical protein [Microbacterium sp. LMI1-1-1.1]|uniref:hypothetical protein n=1 Tax=Microbacterium sp. LMI1-1-1.1 TaxID=3135223 RepID=UPI003467D63D